jgi:predicted RNase H-like HicB family nuclease
MQYQVFVKGRSDRGFTASVLEIPSIAANGNTEGEAIANAKTELESQLSTGKIVTISLAEPLAMSIEPKTKPLSASAAHRTGEAVVKTNRSMYISNSNKLRCQTSFLTLVF